MQPLEDDITDVTIRPANARDVAAVSALLSAADLAPNALSAQFGPQFVVAVRPATGAVVGAAGVEVYTDGATSVGLLRSAVVDKRFQGRGLGAALTENRLRWAEREALVAVYLLTETAADYWPRFGFQRMDRETAPPALQTAHEWRQGCPASAVAMRLELPRTSTR